LELFRSFYPRTALFYWHKGLEEAGFDYNISLKKGSFPKKPYKLYIHFAIIY
jgi:hypothetical protein